ncbi:M23 family metallopeptidase [Streptomyces sp. NBC_01803]|uniref:M23 family metallopeptidase n=1 Tax=Streptomyces sp. NBC_01803 TaxID=2975946 RepID=UPI002DDC2CED|nr:M23 family metallopeptidase [Streptomyces sp. NBC_01803]WSA46213.1 M23 family metallopeptidase [Streptomyces sp. NBC_01803]
MSERTIFAPPARPVTRHRRRRPRATPVRLARRAVGSTLLGALVIAGPWTAEAAGHDRPAADRSESPAARGPEPRESTWLYEAPFGPYPAARREEPRPPVVRDADAWVAPVSGHPVSEPYGTPGSWAAGHHTGVDFATPIGTTVSSVGPGTVMLAENSGDYGELVIVKMTDGYYTLYAHLSEISVREGQQVKAGNQVGETGDTGNSTGPHLHFEVRAGAEYGTDVDPIAYLADHGVTID